MAVGFKPQVNHSKAQSKYGAGNTQKQLGFAAFKFKANEWSKVDLELCRAECSRGIAGRDSFFHHPTKRYEGEHVIVEPQPYHSGITGNQEGDRSLIRGILKRLEVPVEEVPWEQK